MNIPITVAYGDGIGPEIMQATLAILEAAGAKLAVDVIEIGEKIYLQGVSSGITQQTWESLKRTKLLLKGPITTPQGSGYKSLNVTLRKTLGLYANVRPCMAYTPFVHTQHPKMDVVIIRDNEEDLYAGIEHQQTPQVVQCLKLITEPGCERIIRYAFEYARAYNRKKVSCFTKDNIMKLTDGLFHRVFDRIKSDYPDIITEHLIIDIGTAKLATKPEQFDVIVLPNLYGDILSDVAAEISGSVGLAGSANIGEHYAMFEAIHGSAPDIAGKDLANPSGLLLAAIMMLAHIGQTKAANKIEQAWLKTIESGIHTADIYSENSKLKVGTQQFAQAVIDFLGESPKQLKGTGCHKIIQLPKKSTVESANSIRQLVGVDIFVYFSRQGAIKELAAALSACERQFKLTLITNRGIKVWPEGFADTFCVDHWRCRFKANDKVTAQDIAWLLVALSDQGIDVIKTENLYEFDGKPGYSLGQGE